MTAEQKTTATESKAATEPEIIAAVAVENFKHKR